MKAKYELGENISRNEFLSHAFLSRWYSKYCYYLSSTYAIIYIEKHLSFYMGAIRNDLFNSVIRELRSTKVIKWRNW